MVSDERPRLAGDELVNLLELVKDADSVELKATVPASSSRSMGAALGMDPLDAQIRQVLFLDTPDLRLSAAGIVLRARRVQRRPGDSVVKLRPVVPSELDPAVRASPGFGVEVDVMPGGYVCSASMRRKLPDRSVVESMSGRRPLRKLFSKTQRRLFAAHAPDGLTIDDLSVLGPIFVLKLKTVPDGFSRPLVAEMWLYPDGSRILELSTKCAPGDAVQVAAETRRFLEGKGASVDGEQQTKTKAALEFFSAELQGAVGG
jgi:hypothetical protein